MPPIIAEYARFVRALMQQDIDDQILQLFPGPIGNILNEKHVKTKRAHVE